MLSKFNFLSVRSAKTTADRPAYPAFTRGLNTTFNTEMSFGGRVLLPLMAALKYNVLRRTPRQSRSYIHTVLLTGMLGFALLLAGCAGGGGGGGTPPVTIPPDPAAVSKVRTTVSGNNITVRWTNPDQANITGFNITWINVGDDADGGEIALNASQTNVAAGADNTHKITNLDYAATYRITVTVLYADQDPVASDPTSVPPAMTGMDPDNPVVPLDPAAVSNINAMASGNNITVSWTNPDRESITGFNIAWVNVGDDTDSGTRELDSADLLASGAQSMYTITGLTYRATYKITVTVLYADQDPAASAPIQTQEMTEPDPNDLDGDGVVNAEDLDYDGDGLIEIHNLDQLALLRGDLNGDGDDDDENDDITAVGTAGCPSSGCIGYELTRSLNFSDAVSYADGMVNAAWTSDSGWQPIGSCSALDACTPYTGIFDGRGYRIADLFISVNDTVNGVGLFGAFNGRLQNLHLLNVRVSGGANHVGGLVGYGANARYESLSVTAGSVMSSLSRQEVGLGGLIGNGQSSVILYANVSGVTVSGANSVGGLVGQGEDADIRSVYVSDGSVTGSGANSGSFVGGLAGVGDNADIRYAGVSGVDISGLTSVGGLAGTGNNADIRYAGVFGGDVSGFFGSVGGLVGFGNNISIHSVYASDGEVTGGGSGIGGLIGLGEPIQLDFSYAATGPVSATSNIPEVSGLIGTPSLGIVNDSYWDRNTTGQSASSGGGTRATTAQLQNPITFSGSIYANWGNFWCDPNTGAERTSTTPLSAPYVRVWDLGTANQYPVLNCLPVSAEEQQQRQ